MKKIVSTFIILLTFTLLSACSNEAKPQEVSNTENQSTTVETTTQITKLDNVSQIIIDTYELRDSEGAGAFGELIYFKPVENADGYQLKCIIDGAEITDYEPIPRGNETIAISGQDGPSEIYIRAYKELDSKPVFGEWVLLLSPTESEIRNHEAISFKEWEEITKDIYPFEPFSYQEEGEY